MSETSGLGQGVSVISLQTLVQTSQSYQSRRETSRLTHIGLIWVILTLEFSKSHFLDQKISRKFFAKD